MPISAAQAKDIRLYMTTTETHIGPDHPIRRVSFCPHCGNVATQHLVYEQYFETYGYKQDGTRTESDIPSKYFVAVCETCGEILIYLAEGYIPDAKEFVEAGLMWPPRPGFLDKNVPKNVRECYEEASLVKHLSPNAFAVLLRRALEMIADEQGATRGTLYQRLKDLADQGKLPPLLIDMTDILRLLGNKAAHMAEDNVQPGHVDIIDDFFNTVVEYIYIAPGKLKALRNQLPSKDGIDKT
jgi:hypothetical protein